MSRLSKLGVSAALLVAVVLLMVLIVGSTGGAAAAPANKARVSAPLTGASTGPRGPRGTAGPRGPRGFKGSKGQAGPAGRSGPTGATGPAAAFSTGIGAGGRLDTPGEVTVASLSVPAGKYVVTATLQVLNFTLNPTEVDCRLADSTGTFGQNSLYAPSGPSEAMALQGTTSSPSAADTINLQCSAVVPASNVIVQSPSVDAIKVATINGS